MSPSPDETLIRQLSLPSPCPRLELPVLDVLGTRTRPGRGLQSLAPFAESGVVGGHPRAGVFRAASLLVAEKRPLRGWSRALRSPPLWR